MISPLGALPFDPARVRRLVQSRMHARSRRQGRCRGARDRSLLRHLLLVALECGNVDIDPPMELRGAVADESRSDSPLREPRGAGRAYARRRALYLAPGARPLSAPYAVRGTPLAPARQRSLLVPVPAPRVPAVEPLARPDRRARLLVRLHVAIRAPPDTRAGAARRWKMVYWRSCRRGVALAALAGLGAARKAPLERLPVAPPPRLGASAGVGLRSPALPGEPLRGRRAATDRRGPSGRPTPRPVPPKLARPSGARPPIAPRPGRSGGDRSVPGRRWRPRLPRRRRRAQLDPWTIASRNFSGASSRTSSPATRSSRRSRGAASSRPRCS